MNREESAAPKEDKMGLLQRLFGKEHDSGEQAVALECMHADFVARWDDPADLGKEDRASSWMCTSCEESFTAQQREALVRAEIERVRQYQEEKRRG